MAIKFWSMCDQYAFSIIEFTVWYGRCTTSMPSVLHEIHCMV